MTTRFASQARLLRALLLPLALVAPVIVGTSGAAQACGYHDCAGCCRSSHRFGLGFHLGCGHASREETAGAPSATRDGVWVDGGAVLGWKLNPMLELSGYARVAYGAAADRGAIESGIGLTLW